MRIVSLLPSATEIVYALGLDRDLVGVTFECDEPASARTDNEVVVGGRDTSTMTPRQIDDYVRAAMAAGQDLYTLTPGAMARLRPELILTQDLCRVCAVPSGHVQEALAHLDCHAEVVSLDPHSLDDVLQTILVVGDRGGALDGARMVVAGLRTRLAAVTAAVRGRPAPRVAVIEWVDPPFAAGHWIPDLVVAAGGIPVGGSPRARSLQTTWEQVRAAEPDVIVVAPCGFHLAGAAEQARLAVAQVPGAAVWAIDADSIVVRPGPRLVDGVEAMASIFHPGTVPTTAAVQLISPAVTINSATADVGPVRTGSAGSPR